MVKRKWLWGKRSSGETESSGSMSALSDKFLDDQDASKRFPSNTPPEVTSGAYGETNGEETNDSSQTLTRTSSDCLTKENLAMDRSTERLSDAEVDDRAEDRLTKEYLSIITLDRSTEKLSEAQVDGGIEDSPFQDILSKCSVDETELEHAATETSSNCKEDNGSLKLLTEKLSAALLNVSIKDDLVKQHSKVAEEAVAGWEKAENEVGTLKQQLETAVQQKSGLENRVSHLDEALKECVRQLRLARDEQERKIIQAVAEKTNELEIAKTRLEHQLVELQVENPRVSSPDPELLQKLEILERENLTLRKEFQSQSEELEVRTIERDLSTKAAETASKQHLESIKKLAKLEAECRKLKSLSRNDHKSTAVAPSYVESLTDSQLDSSEHLSTSESYSRKINGVGLCERNTNQSESWAAALIAELDQFKSEKLADKNMHASPLEIDLMDDFLEMERLAALPPDGKPKVHSAHPDQVNEKPVPEAESKLKTELESVINSTAELEEKIEKLELEKTELSLTLAQTQDCLEKSQFQLIETHMKLELERELHGANEAEEFYKAGAVSYEKEAELMSSQIKSLKADIDREQVLSVEKSIRCEELENELEMVKAELEIQKGAISDGELKIKEIELAQTQECLEKLRAQLRGAENKLEELQKKLDEGIEEKKSLKLQLDSMRTEKSIRCEELENELEKIKAELEIQKGAISDGDLKRKESELAQTRECLEKSQVQLREAESKLEELQKELYERNEAEISLKSQLDSMRTEVQTMSTQTESLKERVHKEQALTAELSTKCQELEIELRRRRQELEVQQKPQSNNELKIKQEDLVVAAGKLADCQKTIASLGSQLKSLATLEDFLIDTAGIPGFSLPAPLMARRTEDLWRLHSNHTFWPKKEYEPLSNSQEGLSHFTNHNRRDNRDSPASSSSSTSSAYFMNPPGSEKNGNGFAKYFALSRN